MNMFIYTALGPASREQCWLLVTILCSDSSLPEKRHKKGTVCLLSCVWYCRWWVLFPYISVAITMHAVANLKARQRRHNAPGDVNSVCGFTFGHTWAPVTNSYTCVLNHKAHLYIILYIIQFCFLLIHTQGRALDSNTNYRAKYLFNRIYFVYKVEKHFKLSYKLL